MVEKKKLYQDPTWLRDRYLNEYLSAVEIAKLTDCSHTNIYVWLKKFGIPIRKRRSPLSRKHRMRISESVKAAYARGAYVDSFGNDRRKDKLSKATLASFASGVYGEAWREKKSVAMRAAWAAEDSVLGSPPWREKVSISVSSAYRDNPEYGRKVSAAVRAARASGAYDGVFQSPTSIEVAISDVLDFLSTHHMAQL